LQLELNELKRMVCKRDGSIVPCLEVSGLMKIPAGTYLMDMRPKKFSERRPRNFGLRPEFRDGKTSLTESGQPGSPSTLMAGHTNIFPKTLFWYHLLTALAYKTPGPIIDKDLIGNTKGIT
jgi:hypothetical protein